MVGKFKTKIEADKNNSSNNKINNEISYNNKTMIKKVKITTEDGVEIIGDFYFNKESKYAGILVHMMPSDRKSLKELANKLLENGYSSIAIDLRGHGESINSTKGILDYTKFSDKEHQDSIFDLRAASNFLKDEGFPEKNQFLIGASIGANLSLQFVSQRPEIKAVVLLSPGKNYRNIEIDKFLDKNIENKILVVLSKEDKQSYNSYEIFKEKTPSSTILVYEGGHHGTDLLKVYPDLTQSIVNFLKERLIE
jgi:dienelactone hydrolase